MNVLDIGGLYQLECTLVHFLGLCMVWVDAHVWTWQFTYNFGWEMFWWNHQHVSLWILDTTWRQFIVQGPCVRFLWLQLCVMIWMWNSFHFQLHVWLLWTCVCVCWNENLLVPLLSMFANTLCVWWLIWLICNWNTLCPIFEMTPWPFDINSFLVCRAHATSDRLESQKCNQLHSLVSLQCVHVVSTSRNCHTSIVK